MSSYKNNNSGTTDGMASMYEASCRRLSNIISCRELLIYLFYKWGNSLAKGSDLPKVTWLGQWLGWSRGVCVCVRSGVRLAGHKRTLLPGLLGCLKARMPGITVSSWAHGQSFLFHARLVSLRSEGKLVETTSWERAAPPSRAGRRPYPWP